MKSLVDEIAAIGRRMVACRENCIGIQRNQTAGLLPRCLVLETDRRSASHGVIVCGLNPAPADDCEVEFYRRHHASYESLLRYWDEGGLRDISYYSRLRAFVSQLGHDGPILWTDIAKCQNKSGSEKLSIKNHPQTFRTCSASYLIHEIATCPSDWPIVAAGRDAFTALLYLFPNRALIGVPHPTGRFANTQFLRLFESGLKLREDIKSLVRRHFESEPRGILQIPSQPKQSYSQ